MNIERISEFVEVTPELMKLCRENEETARVVKQMVFKIVKQEQQLNLWDVWYRTNRII